MADSGKLVGLEFCNAVDGICRYVQSVVLPQSHYGGERSALLARRVSFNNKLSHDKNKGIGSRNTHDRLVYGTSVGGCRRNDCFMFFLEDCFSMLGFDWNCLFICLGAFFTREEEIFTRGKRALCCFRQTAAIGGVWHFVYKYFILDSSVLFFCAEPSGLGSKELVAHNVCHQPPH